MTDRISCCIPFCRRTTKHECQEWICGKHWPLVPRHMRRRDSKLVRLYLRRYGKTSFWQMPAGSPQRIAAIKLSRICETSWTACKKQAIERAAGI